MPQVGTLVPLARRTTGGAAMVSQISQEHISILTSVTVIAGTLPTLAVTIQWSHDGETWADDADGVEVFPILSTAGARVRRLAVKGPYARVSWAISGVGAAFTFGVTSY